MRNASGKRTTREPSPERRSYELYCAVARALDRVGDRWTLLIIRDLVHLGPRRYTDLLRALPGIGTNILAARLSRLEQDGIVRRHRLRAPAASVVYELTELGSGLEPAVIALGRWGGNFMSTRREEDTFFPNGHISAIRATFDPRRAGGATIVAELRVDGESLAVSIADGQVNAREGSIAQPDVIIETDIATSIDLMLRRIDPALAVDLGLVRITGSPTSYRSFIEIVAWVPLPPTNGPDSLESGLDEVAQEP